MVFNDPKPFMVTKFQCDNYSVLALSELLKLEK